MDVNTANDYIVDLIRKYYESTVIKNKRFSMRALAQRFDVSPSTLSEVLSKKRRLNKATAQKIIQIIAPDDVHAVDCLNLLEDHYSPYKVDEIETLHIQQDQALLFEKWYHLAILVFIDSRKYDGSLQSISDYFGITLEQAKNATQRLLRLGLVTNSDGRLLNRAQYYVTEPSKISDSLHKSKRSALQNALGALDNKSIESSSSFSMMFTVFDKNLVPEAVEYLDKMKRGFVKKFNGKGDKSALYQLSLQFFPCEGIGENSKEDTV